MIEPLTQYPYLLGAVAVALVAVGRLYVGPQFRDIPWQPLRRVLIPIIDRKFQRRFGEDYRATYEITEEELIADDLQLEGEDG